jgi:prefoldin subunit 5
MRLTSALAGILLVAVLATPALAGPGEGEAAAPRTQPVEKQIQRLTKELKQLEKQLEKARAANASAETDRPAAEARRRALGEQQRRMAEARRRLAGLLAERGADDAPRPPRAARPPHTPQAPQPPQPAAPPRTRRGPAPAESGQGPAWTGALRRLHEENRRLAARVQVLERQIRRVGAAIGKLRPAGDTPQAGPEHARQGPRSRGQHAGRARRQGGSVEARLARLERAVHALVARERGQGRAARGMHRRAMQRGPQSGPRWMQRARGPHARAGGPSGAGRPQAMSRHGRGDAAGRGSGMGPGRGPGDGPGHRGPRAQHRGGPAWSRMLAAKNRMHGPASRSTDGPRRGRWASGRPDDRMGERAMQRGRGHPDAACPFCAN